MSYEQEIPAMGVFPPEQKIVALPGWRNPRVVVPYRHHADRVLPYFPLPAFTSKAELRRVAFAGQVALGLVQPRYARGPWLLKDLLLQAGIHLDSKLGLGLIVGTPGPYQKVTIAVSTRNGPLAFAKIAYAALARGRIQREAALLSGLPEGLAPSVLWYGSYRETSQALVLSPARGRHWRWGLSRFGALAGYHSRLMTGDSIGLEDCSEFSTAVTQLGEQAEALFDPLRSRKWPMVIRHGDFAPWNIIVDQTGNVRAIDWEYGHDGGFPYVDLAHFILQFELLIAKARPSRSLEIGSSILTKHTALGAAEARSVLRLAAIEAYSHGIEEGQGNAPPWQLWRRRVWEA